MTLHRLPDTAPGAAPLSPERAQRTWRASLAVSALVLMALVVAARAIGPAPGFPGNLLFLATLYARLQDVPFALSLIAVFAACLLLARRQREPLRAPALPAPVLATGLFALVLLAWFLRRYALFDYDFSRDEQMARFDAAIFASGHLYGVLAPAWRPFHDALNTLFTLTVGNHEGWVSSYLPGNAALQCVLGLALPDGLAVPILAAIGGAALWSIARRLWPASPTSVTVAMVLYLGSAQVLLTATTRFAMTAHLACNLVWLALFLKDRPWSHTLALATGLLATGLHQPLFHPLFVAPFLLVLLMQRRLGLLAFYFAGYAAIGLVWMAWPGWITSLGSVPPPPSGHAVGYLDRLEHALHVPGLVALWIQCANALRLFTWQHVLLLPLALVGLGTLRREPIALACALGLGFTFLALFILLPLQGHGYGYRYAHGLIGNLCLLGAFGWHRLEQAGRAPHTSFLAASALTFLVAMPLHLVMARSFLAPSAALEAAVAASGKDVTVVEDEGVIFGDNFVINRADLRNRPLRLEASALDARKIARLCRHHRLAFVTAPQMNPMRQLYEQAPRRAPGADMARLIATARHLDCIAPPAH